MDAIAYLEANANVAGYTVMKHSYEPTIKYRVQVWYMLPGAAVPAGFSAWATTPIEAAQMAIAKAEVR